MKITEEERRDALLVARRIRGAPTVHHGAGIVLAMVEAIREAARLLPEHLAKELEPSKPTPREEAAPGDAVR